MNETKYQQCRRDDCSEPVRLNRAGYSMGYCEPHCRNKRSRTPDKETFEGTDGYPAYVSKGGYVRLMIPGAEATPEHRYVMQKHIGRSLVRGETVHHKNGDRSDNRLENLELWAHSHPYGQRVTDLIPYFVEFHRDAITKALKESEEAK